MTKNNGTSYERVTRQMVISIESSVKEIKGDIRQLTNHYSKRLPHWATIGFTLLTTLCAGLIVRGIYV